MAGRRFVPDRLGSSGRSFVGLICGALSAFVVGELLCGLRPVAGAAPHDEISQHLFGNEPVLTEQSVAEGTGRSTGYANTRFSFTVELPPGWEELPNLSGMQSDLLAIARARAQGVATLDVPVVFQRRQQAPLSFPYIVVTAIDYPEQQQIRESRMGEYASLFVNMLRTRLAEMRGTIGNARIDEPELVAGSRHFTVAGSAEVQGSGRVKLVIDTHFGSRHVLQLMFVSKDTSYPQDLLEFQKFLASFRFDAAAEFNEAEQVMYESVLSGKLLGLYALGAVCFVVMVAATQLINRK